jgi:hypothetical protein
LAEEIPGSLENVMETEMNELKKRTLSNNKEMPWNLI